jgi:hypothetical protein
MYFRTRRLCRATSAFGVKTARLQLPPASALGASLAGYRPGRLTHTTPAGPARTRWPGSATAHPADLHFSGQKVVPVACPIGW